MVKLTLPRVFICGAITIIGTILVPAVANAKSGFCPPDKTGINLRKANATPGQGVTDSVLSSIDLSKEPINVKGHLLRMRKLVIQPGGVVPWHSHADRPAIILIESGEITEYSSTCSVPIIHKVGDATPELHTTSHWWKNTGTVPVVILAADIAPMAANPGKM